MHQRQEPPIIGRSTPWNAIPHEHFRGCFVEQNPTAMATKTPIPSSVFLFLLPVLLTSCGQYYYMANVTNVPLFREKGEACATVVKANAGLPAIQELPSAIGNTIVEQSNSIEIQAAYALTDHWAVMANGAYYTNDEDRAHLWEIGAGYHAWIARHFVAEAYAGVGIGRLLLSEEYGKVTEVPLTRGFLQPDIGYVSRNFEAALSVRVCPLWYNVPDQYMGPFEDAVSLIPTSCRVLVEPALTLRFGLRMAKLQFQWCYSQNMGEEFDMVDQTFSAGLQFNINNAFKKRTSSHP